jgi:hypothetical protein
MGIGPWQQGEMVRDVERAERARFRRAINRERKYLHSIIGNICSRDILDACDRLMAATKPKDRKS